MATPTLINQTVSNSEGIAKLNGPGVEPGAALRLHIGSIQSSNSRRSYHCRFIKAGRVRTNSNTPSEIEITPHALQSAWSAGLFNGKAVFIDHAALWDPHLGGTPSLENLVGVTQSSNWNETDQSIEGTIKLYTSATGLSIASLLDELLTEDSPPDIGLSLVFYTVWEENLGMTFQNSPHLQKYKPVASQVLHSPYTWGELVPPSAISPQGRI